MVDALEEADDWTEHEDPASGRVYYHSPSINTSVWKELVVTVNKSVNFKRNRPEISAALQETDDWVEHRDPGTGRFYLHRFLSPSVCNPALLPLFSLSRFLSLSLSLHAQNGDRVPSASLHAVAT